MARSAGRKVPKYAGLEWDEGVAPVAATLSCLRVVRRSNVAIYVRERTRHLAKCRVIRRAAFREERRRRNRWWRVGFLDVAAAAAAAELFVQWSLVRKSVDGKLSMLAVSGKAEKSTRQV